MRNNEQWEPFREQHGPSESWGVRTKETHRALVAATYRLDAQDADLIARTHNARLKEQPDKIWIESIVSHRTMMPVYRFQYGDTTWELDLVGMRVFIADLYQALEAGISDAFIAAFVRQRLAPEAAADEQGHLIASMMVEFRNFRELLNNPMETSEGPVS